MSTQHPSPGTVHPHGPSPTRPWPVQVGFWLLLGIAAFYLSYPVLVWAYSRLARREENDCLIRFGDDYIRYMQEVPAFIPRRRRGPAPSQGEAP